jgi:predicted TIM-barrel fold metal-dependent hydrolase
MSQIAIIDTDAHVTELPDLWTSRVSKKWGDLIPHTRIIERPKTVEQGHTLALGSDFPPIEAWFTGDTYLVPAGQSAFAGWHEPFPAYPPMIKDAHPASYDVTERLKLMNEQGIYAQGIFPNVGGFGSARFRMMPEQDLALECVRAYNDYIYDWVEPARDRFILNAPIPYWNLDESVKELRRAAAKGFKTAIFSGAPHEHGLPYIADAHWDPLWNAAQDAGMAISFHLGSGDMHGKHFQPERVRLSAPAETATRLITMGFLESAQQVTDLLHSGVLNRFPDLKFIAAESGIGWIPFVLESADYHYRENTNDVVGDELLPSERFHRQVYASFWFERIAPERLLDVIGERNVIFETDFPHPSSLWPTEAVRSAAHSMDSLPEPVRRRVLRDNAVELYRLDPKKVDAWEATLSGG